MELCTIDMKSWANSEFARHVANAQDLVVAMAVLGAAVGDVANPVARVHLEGGEESVIGEKGSTLPL